MHVAAEHAVDAAAVGVERAVLDDDRAGLPLDRQRADLELEDLGVEPRLLRVGLVEQVRAFADAQLGRP